MVEDYRMALSRFSETRVSGSRRAGSRRTETAPDVPGRNLSSKPGTRSGRKGLSTGSCACAAAVAATRALLDAEADPYGSAGSEALTVTIQLPRSTKPWSELSVLVPVSACSVSGGEARAVVHKDSGDDTDCTNGMPVVARVRWRQDSRICIAGGPGVGRVTRPGLPVAPGEAAINPVPLGMIRTSVQALAGGRGLDVIIELPWGEALAPRTWNLRIGILGGLSVIGTNGVVEPASSSAYRRSLYVTLKAYRARGLKTVWLGPGYVSERYFGRLGIPEDQRIVVGDHFGFALDACARLGFEAVAIAAHGGKLLKLGAGIFNTHARYGDARLETLAACAAAAGAPRELAEAVLACTLAEEASVLIAEAGFDPAFGLAAGRAAQRCNQRSGLPIRCVMVNLEGELLGAGEAGGYTWR